MNDTTNVPRQIVEQMAEALIFADPEGIIRMWNPGAEALFGHSADEAVGRSLDLIVPERLRQAHWEGYRRAMSEGATKYGREPLLTRTAHRDGTTMYVDMGLAVVTDGRGNVAGAVAIVRNATQRREHERGLRGRIAELEARLEGGSDPC